MEVEEIRIKVLGKSYIVAAPSHEKENLLKAVELLNQKIQLIQSTAANMDNEKITIMAALNLTHDLLKTSSKQPVATKTNILPDENDVRKINELIELCDKTLKI